VPTLSEAESKQKLAARGVPVPAEALVSTPEEAAAAAARLGFPVVAKLCGPTIAHKTERGLVRLGLTDEGAVEAAAADLLAAARPDDGEVGVLVGQMVRGGRELIAGMGRDPQFGPYVMLGLGGILAEAVAEVVFRLVPLARVDAEEMIEQLPAQRLLAAFRGEPEVDRSALADVLVALSDLAAAEPRLMSADLNPLIISDGRPVAVDALLEMA